MVKTKPQHLGMEEEITEKPTQGLLQRERDNGNLMDTRRGTTGLGGSFVSSLAWRLQEYLPHKNSWSHTFAFFGI